MRKCNVMCQCEMEIDRHAIVSAYTYLCLWCFNVLDFPFFLFVVDVQVLLMTDILVFLQEKDQRYIFASLVSYFIC